MLGRVQVLATARMLERSQQVANPSVRRVPIQAEERLRTTNDPGAIVEGEEFIEDRWYAAVRQNLRVVAAGRVRPHHNQDDTVRRNDAEELEAVR
jgi:hypothetical protein